MATRSLRTLALLAAILSLTITRGGAQQSSPATGKIVYESCYADLSVYDVFCDIRVWTDSADFLLATEGRLPRWSPDGTKVAYVAYGYNASGQVVVTDVRDPVNTVMVAAEYSSVYPVGWFSDGRLSFASDRTGTAELYTVNADGTGQVQITNGIGFTGIYALAPSGQRIAIVRQTAEGTDLFRINADGSGLIRLTSNGTYSGGRIAWSYDSTRIVFDCAGRVCRVNADGTGLVELTTDGSSDGALSPSGDRLAYIAPFDGAYEPAVLNADGTVIRLASGTPGRMPLWSDDGSRLLFQGTAPVGYSGRCYFGGSAHPADDFCVPITGIYLVTADATGLRLLATGSSPDWLPAIPGEPLAAFAGDCIATECTFDATSSSDPEGDSLTYSWRFGDGTSGSGATVHHTYAAGAQYTVALTVTDTDGQANTVSRTFLANSAPSAAFTYSCVVATCTFDASATRDDGTIIEYAWNFGDGETVYVIQATHTFATGSFVVRLFASDNAGSYGTAEATVTVVNPRPTAAFTASCTSFECTFNAAGTSDDAWFWFRWNFGDGTSGSGASDWGGPSTTHRYVAPGTYAVTLTVTDLAGQTATFAASANVNPERMHVGDIDGRRESSSRGWWYPIVTITVHAADERPLVNVLVAGSWSTGETAYCFTKAAGQCSVYGPPSKGSMAPPFSVQSLTHDAFAYSPSANHDPDGETNGTTITVVR